MILQSSVIHSSSLVFRQALARNQLRFRLLTASDSDAMCTLCLFKRSEPEKQRRIPMQRRSNDGIHAEWVCDVSFDEEAHYIKYTFFIEDQDEALYFSEHGFSSTYPSEGFFELLQVQESDLPSSPEWTRGCTYYQIFPERYAKALPSRREYEPWDAEPTRDNFLGGDLKGIAEKLPYIQSLGVNCLYLNPIFAADFNHKYATTDYFEVDPDFGTKSDLAALVDAAHGLGIRVVLDGVFNHVGIHFPPFADVQQNGRASRYVDWFFIKKEPIAIDPACYECVGDYPYMPRLRVANQEVRQYVLSVLRYWIETAHIDGWRLDVADELDSESTLYWRREILRSYPQTLFLAETWGDATALVGKGDCFDSAMNYLFRDAMVSYFAKGSLSETAFIRRMEHMRMKYGDELLLRMFNLIGSHDTPRFLTECGGDSTRMQLAVAFQMTYPGSPTIYYGDELAMEGEYDPGCRGGMAWEKAEASEMLQTYRLWAKRRKEHPALVSGSYRTVLADDGKHVIAYERADETERLLVIINNSPEKVTLDISEWGGQVDILPHSVKIVNNFKEVVP